MPLKRIQRDPMTFDAFDAFAELRRHKGLNLEGELALEDEFLPQIRKNVQAARESPHLLHGRRTEAMFEALVASLGNVQLLKHEDAGGGWTETNIVLPDFHLVMKDGTRLLVEVKNYFQGNNAFADFSMRGADLVGRQTYAELLGCPLMIAIYWAKWGKWSLNRPERFRTRGSRARISFVEAMKSNHMAMLGDLMIATTPPLSLHLIANAAYDRTINESGQVAFTVGDAGLYCAGRELTRKVEQKICLYMMCFGSWEAKDSVETDHDQLHAITWNAAPAEATEQGFEIVGSLSEMFSRYYLFRSTSENNRVIQTRVPFAPGFLGSLIPESYTGENLPLWRFELKPSDSGDQDSPRDSQN